MKSTLRQPHQPTWIIRKIHPACFWKCSQPHLQHQKHLSFSPKAMWTMCLMGRIFSVKVCSNWHFKQIFRSWCTYLYLYVLFILYRWHRSSPKSAADSFTTKAAGFNHLTDVYRRPRSTLKCADESFTAAASSPNWLTASCWKFEAKYWSQLSNTLQQWRW